MVVADNFTNKDDGEQRKEWLEGLEYKMGKVNIMGIEEKLDHYLTVWYTLEIIYLEDGKEIDNEFNDYEFIMKIVDPYSKDGEELIQQKTLKDAEWRFPLRVEKIKEEIYVKYENEWEYDGEKWEDK